MYFEIHPQKTKVLVWGETKQCKMQNSVQREWLIGPNRVEEVDSHTHCGVLLTTAKSNIDRTKAACRKGRGIMSSICNGSVLGRGKLNPLTCIKLYHTIVLPSALFGC